MKRLTRLTRFLVPSPCYLCGAPSVKEIGLCPRCAEDFWPENRADIPRCPQCALPVRAIGRLCAACLGHPPCFDQSIAGCDFQEASRYLIHRLKYRHDIGVLDALLEPLIFAIERAYDPDRNLDGDQDGVPADGAVNHWPEVLVPMPIHPVRRRARGFNQARLIADRLGRRFGLPVRGDLVSRIGSSTSQSELSAKERRKSLKNAFVVGQHLPHHVAIVDDVMTTGSSADTLALALKHAGASRVSVWVLARTPTPEVA